jgi:hypothetical protein
MLQVAFPLMNDLRHLFRRFKFRGLMLINQIDYFYDDIVFIYDPDST